MIVVDTNVLAYFYIESEHTSAAEALRVREPDWAAPLLWRSEFRNVLAGHIRRRGMTFEQAVSRQRDAEMFLAETEYKVDSRAVFELVRDSPCTAYDCEFIALARMLKTKLVTMDGKLLQAFPDDAVALTAATSESTA